jgi:hypothetical protein
MVMTAFEHVHQLEVPRVLLPLIFEMAFGDWKPSDITPFEPTALEISHVPTTMIQPLRSCAATSVTKSPNSKHRIRRLRVRPSSSATMNSRSKAATAAYTQIGTVDSGSEHNNSSPMYTMEEGQDVDRETKTNHDDDNDVGDSDNESNGNDSDEDDDSLLFDHPGLPGAEAIVYETGRTVAPLLTLIHSHSDIAMLPIARYVVSLSHSLCFCSVSYCLSDFS